MLPHESLIRHGYAIVPDVLPPAAVAELASALSSVQSADAAREKNRRIYAMRNLLALVPSVRALADSTELRSLVEPELGPGARAVRGLLLTRRRARTGRWLGTRTCRSR